MKNIKILLAGRLDLGPLGRHIISFLEAISQNPKNEIYIDLYYLELYRCDGLSTDKLLTEYTKRRNIFIANKSTQYDFGIFTDLLTLKYDDKYKEFLTRNCKVRICYEVYDGSIPPIDWIDIINDHFDICLSPSIYISQSFSSAGVKVPCFNLPCTVFNDQLLAKKVATNLNKCRFGFVGGAEQRKNLLKTIEAFHRCFKNNSNVELYVHSSYSAESDYADQVKELVKKYKTDTKIIFKFQDHLGKDQMYDLISTFNFYIYPSKTTGYFTTPAEALSLGIPVIISDIPVHQELLLDLNNDDGVFKINSDIPQPMKHSYLGDKYLGVQYDCSVDEISKQLRIAYDKRDKLFDEKLIKKRKERGRMYSLESVAPLYHSLISPLEFVSSKESFVDKNGIFYCSDFNVLQKYKSIYPDLNYNYKKSFDRKKIDLHIADRVNTEIIENLCREIEFFRRQIASGFSMKREKYIQKITKITNKYNAYGFTKFLYYILKTYCIIKRVLLSPKRKFNRIKKNAK